MPWAHTAFGAQSSGGSSLQHGSLTSPQGVQVPPTHTESSPQKLFMQHGCGGMPHRTQVFMLLQIKLGEKHGGPVAQQGSSSCPQEVGPPRAVPVSISSTATATTAANPAGLRAMQCTRRPYTRRPVGVNKDELAEDWSDATALNAAAADAHGTTGGP